VTVPAALVAVAAATLPWTLGQPPCLSRSSTPPKWSSGSVFRPLPSWTSAVYGARLTKRLEQIQKQNGWGDLSDAAYLAERDAIRTQLASLPDNDRIRSFDAYRARVLELPEAIAVASPARREELCRIVIERIVVRDRQLDSIVWTPPVRPFFEKQRVCPQGDSNP
jgi:hypothetical protein